MEFVATLFGEREANQTAGVPGHEVDDFRSDLLGGADQIAFIFAIFVVNDDDHLAVADIGNGLVNSRNRHGLMLPEKRQPRKVYKGLFVMSLRPARLGFVSEEFFDVFSDDINFEVDVVAGLEMREVCNFPGLRNDSDFEVIVSQCGDGQADAFDSH